MNADTTEGREDHRAPEEDVEEEILAMAARAKDTVEELVREQPHAALGLAAAAGVILGGGLPPPRLFRLGLAVGGPALTRKLAAQAADLVADSLSRHEEGSEERD